MHAESQRVLAKLMQKIFMSEPLCIIKLGHKIKKILSANTKIRYFWAMAKPLPTLIWYNQECR